MRFVLVSSLLVTLGLSTVAVVGCSSGGKLAANDERAGTVGLQLQAAPGVTINTVSYAITGNGQNLTGTIDTSNAQTISAIIGGIPAGSGYTITLNAVSTDGRVTCAGTATFSVTARTTTAVRVGLQCTGQRRNGSVLVNGVLNTCPDVDAISASPASVNTGSSIAIAAVASDGDNGPSPLTRTWTQSSSNGGAGTFASATSASTTFTCTAPGAVTITFAVSDGDCGDQDSVSVTCTGAAIDAGGGGTPDAGGGTPDAGSGGTPDAGSGGGGNSGILAARSAACLACAQTNCTAELDACGAITGNASGGPASGTSRATLCTEALACVFPASGASCAATSGSTCYCGTASGATCLSAGAANGACKTALERGLESTDPSVIATAFGDDTLGGGRAMLLAACLSDNACTSCF